MPLTVTPVQTVGFKLYIPGTRNIHIGVISNCKAVGHSCNIVTNSDFQSLSINRFLNVRRHQPRVVEESVEQRNYSESIAEKIDVEVNSIVLSAYNKAKSILTEYSEQLTAVANALIEKETLSDTEFQAIFPAPNGKKSATPQLNHA